MDERIMVQVCIPTVSLQMDMRLSKDLCKEDILQLLRIYVPSMQKKEAHRFLFQSIYLEKKNRTLKEGETMKQAGILTGDCLYIF